MARTPGRSDTPRNEPLPFKSDVGTTYLKLAKLNWSADGLRTDSYTANPVGARAGHFKITLAAVALNSTHKGTARRLGPKGKLSLNELPWVWAVVRRV